jgi:hypothetical protein
VELHEGHEAAQGRDLGDLLPWGMLKHPKQKLFNNLHCTL